MRRKVDSGRSVSSNSPLSPHANATGVSNLNQSRASPDSPTLSEADEGDIEGEEDLEDAVGQLSFNEDEQVRFHGKASGLHLLAPQERIDGRSEGGIWRFPMAGVWPPLPPTERPQSSKCNEDSASLPPLAEQEKLLDLYWRYVHTALPIVHKQSFLEGFQRGSVQSLLFSLIISLTLPQFYGQQFSSFHRVGFVRQSRSRWT